MFKGSSECIECWLTSLSLSFLSLGALSEIHGIMEMMLPLWEERFLESDKAARAPLSFDGRSSVWWSFTWPGGSHRPCLMTSARASGVTVCCYDSPQGQPCTSFCSRRQTQQEQGWCLLLATSHHPLSSTSCRTRLLHHAEEGDCWWSGACLRPRTWHLIPLSTPAAAWTQADSDLVSLGFRGWIVTELEISVILGSRASYNSSDSYVC